MSLTLRTDRLVLRQVTAATAAAFTELLVDLDADPEVMRHLTGRPTPATEIRDVFVPQLIAAAAAMPNYGRFLAFADGEFVGRVSIRPDVPEDRSGESPAVGEAEIGYRLLRSAWGRGYATEGTIALLQHAFGTLELRRVFAQTMAVNTGSRAVMERAGMTYLRTFHVPFDDPLPGTEHGEVEYEAFAATWSAPSR